MNEDSKQELNVLAQKILETIDNTSDIEELRKICKLYFEKSEAGFVFISKLIEIMEEYLPDMPKLSDADMLDFNVAYSTALSDLIKTNYETTQKYFPKDEE